MDFGAIISWLRDLWNDYIMFWWVIDQYNRGIVLRNGKFHKILEPGFHLKVPFIDKVLEHTVVMTTMHLPPQSLKTKDNKSIVTKVIVKYHIADIKLFLLTVWDATDVISDVTQGIVRDVVVNSTLEHLNGGTINGTITRRTKTQVITFGVEVEKVTITNLDEIKSLRLFNESDGAVVINE